LNQKKKVEKIHQKRKTSKKKIKITSLGKAEKKICLRQKKLKNLEKEKNYC